MIPKRLHGITLLAAFTFGCDDEVPIGSWGKTSGQNGARPALPECLATGEPGPTAPAGPGPTPAVTVPYTDWAVPDAFESIEIDVRLETDTVADGYVFTHEVPFVGGSAVILALQALGGYQADPPSGPVVRTKIAQFWISGPPLAAELGDIAYPDARTYLDFQAGSQWWTVNARYDWQACRTYRLRLAVHSTDASGGLWYGAWILDTVTSVETFLGRMLMPATAGGLTSPTNTWTNRIGWAPLMTCADAEAVSAIFGAPRTDADEVATAPRSHRFGPPACANTRFVDFPSAVRQEVGGAL